MNEEFSTMEDDEMWLDGEGYDFSEDDDDEDDDDTFVEDVAEDDDDEDDDDEAFADAFGDDDDEDDDDESIGGEESEERRWRRRRYSAARRAAARRLRKLRNRAKAGAKLQRKRAARLKRISGATRIRLRPSSGTAGSKSIVARTPTGRIMRIHLGKKGIVTSSHHNKFVQNTNKNLGQLRQSITKNGKAVTSLRKAQEKTTKTLSSQQATMTSSIAKEMGKAQKAAQKELRKEAAKVRKMVKDANRRQMLNQLTLATAIPVFRAYGESGDPFSQRNLTLLGGTLAAMYSDELLQKFTRGSTSDQLATGWSYGAPLLLAGAAHLAFKDDPTESQYVVHPVEVTLPDEEKSKDVEIEGIAAHKDSKVVGILNIPDDTVTITADGTVSSENKLKLSMAVAKGSTQGQKKLTAVLIIDNKV